MSYRVVAPLVIAQDKDGHYHHVYEGGVIGWLNPDQKKHFLAEKLVEETGSDDGESEGDKPAKSALKPELVAWLVDNAVDEDGNDYDADELEKLNKDQLWERIDAVED